MFKINQSDSFKWPVVVRYPQDGGKYAEEVFDAVFRRIPQSEGQEILASYIKGDLSDLEICKKIMVGWAGVTDNDQEIPFSPSNFDQLLDVPLVAEAIVEAYKDSITGAKRKN